MIELYTKTPDLLSETQAKAKILLTLPSNYRNIHNKEYKEFIFEWHCFIQIVV